jgi:hypothetical protein
MLGGGGVLSAKTEVYAEVEVEAAEYLDQNLEIISRKFRAFLQDKGFLAV